MDVYVCVCMDVCVSVSVHICCCSCVCVYEVVWENETVKWFSWHCHGSAVTLSFS